MQHLKKSPSFIVRGLLVVTARVLLSLSRACERLACRDGTPAARSRSLNAIQNLEPFGLDAHAVKIAFAARVRRVDAASRSRD